MHSYDCACEFGYIYMHVCICFLCAYNIHKNKLQRKVSAENLRTFKFYANLFFLDFYQLYI